MCEQTGRSFGEVKSCKQIGHVKDSRSLLSNWDWNWVWVLTKLVNESADGEVEEGLLVLVSIWVSVFVEF